MLKEDIRKKYKELRKTISPDTATDLSLAIANKLLELPIWDKTNYHLFLAIERFTEVNTDYIMHILHGKDKNIILSKSNFDSLEMEHFLLTDSTKIITNAYGIPEPTQGFSVNESSIDVVFVPLLAFDFKGNRVGYGKGFYDIFLQKCKPETIKIGLSFFEPEPEILNVTPQDIPLDYCVTPTKIFSFKG